MTKPRRKSWKVWVAISRDDGVPALWSVTDSRISCRCYAGKGRKFSVVPATLTLVSSRRKSKAKRGRIMWDSEKA